jgi:hypothetical protein
MGGFFGSLFGGGASDFNPVLGQTGALEGSSAAQGSTLNSQAQGIQGQLNPYFSNMMNNPQGLGATTMSQMMTQAGQGTAGATGAAARTAQDMAARTGNTASVPGAIASANKQGMTNMSNTQNNLAMQNTMQKLQQQQQGAAGLSGLFNSDLSGSMNANKNAISATTNELGAEKAQQQAQQQGISNIMKMAGAGASMMSGGLANLDTTGGSSGGEQVGNFFGGMGL